MSYKVLFPALRHGTVPCLAPLSCLTDSDEPENESKGLKFGAADYIRKSIHVSPLKARIDVHVALLRAEQNEDDVESLMTRII
ncbi:MAG TPA: hypothetical protein GXZ53_07900 [Firmicutes bacterium]|nr:hypothetical protein [Bacillota bacterium]